MIKNINKTSSNNNDDETKDIECLKHNLNIIEEKTNIIKENLDNHNEEINRMKSMVTKQTQEIKYLSFNHQKKIEKMKIKTKEIYAIQRNICEKHEQTTKCLESVMKTTQGLREFKHDCEEDINDIKNIIKKTKIQ